MKQLLQRTLCILVCLSLLIPGLSAWSEEACIVLSAREETPAEGSGGDALTEFIAPADGDAIEDPSFVSEAYGDAVFPETTPSGEAAEDEAADPEESPAAAEESAAQRDAAVDAIISDLIARLNAQNYTTQFDKALWLYDQTAANIAPGSGDTLYGAIVQKSATSLGYARAYDTLMGAAGIDCAVLQGTDRSWNIAKVDGYWTHIDVYTDDVNGTLGRHFGLTDAAMARDHEWYNEEFPRCTGSVANYYVCRQDYKAVHSWEDMYAHLETAARNKAKVLKLYIAGHMDLSDPKAVISKFFPDAGYRFSQDSFLFRIQFTYPTVTPHPTFNPPLPEDIANITGFEVEYDDESGEAVIQDPSKLEANPPEAIIPAADSIIIGEDELVSISGWTMLPEGSFDIVSYTTSSTSIAPVSADGVVYGKNTGTATITIKANSGPKCTVSVKVKSEPEDVAIVADRTVLGVGEKMQLECTFSSGYAGAVTYSSCDNSELTTLADSNSNPVLTVSRSGLITAVKPGVSTITATTYNGETATLDITVKKAPTAIALDVPELMGVGQEVQAAVTLNPPGSVGSVTYSLTSGSAVTVTRDGLITAESTGTAVVRASTHLEDLYAEQTITVKKAPTSIAFDQDLYTVALGDTLQLAPVLNEGAHAGFTYIAESDAYFILDENGLITPVSRGTAAVRATTHNGLSAVTMVQVTDPAYPESLQLANTPPTYMDVGDTFTPVLSVYPETASPDMEWTSSDTSVAGVNASSGKVTAISYGRATITGVSARNPALSVSYQLIVLGNDLCLTIPNRRTGTGDISTTLGQIRAVRACAYSELQKVYLNGDITQSDHDKRKAYIERAFDMYLMPWMTETLELYWNANNSEDGLKDYKVGTVYYGLPYTQTNRNYNKTKAINGGYFVNAGNYYLMQGSKFSSRMYPGNDCSSYCSMAIWGTDHDHSYDNTRTIASTGVYRTLTDWEDLRPGDLLNKGGSHVVMFLYYANEAKTQIMVIEQGGGELGTNTVSCSIRDVEYYTGRSYKIRRVASLGY